MKNRRVHPYSVLVFVKSFLFAVIIPFLQSLLYAWTNPGSPVTAFYTEAMLAFVLIGWGIFRWNKMCFRILPDEIRVRGGLFSADWNILSFSALAYVYIFEPILPAMFGAGFLHADTAGGPVKHSDISVVLPRKTLQELADVLFDKASIRFRYKSTALSVITMAATWSNAAAGLLIAIPFLNQIGTLLGEELADIVFDVLNYGGSISIVPIPTVTAGLLVLLGGGWVLAFFSQLSRIANFNAAVSGGMILTDCGLIGRRRKLVRISSISAVTIRQTLLMRLMRLNAAYYHSVGCNKEKGERSMLVAAVGKRHLKHTLQGIYPPADEAVTLKKVSKKACWGYVGIPVLECMCLLIIGIILVLTISGYTGVILFGMGFFIVFSVWRFTIRFIGFKQGGIGIGNSVLKISSYKKLFLYEAVIPLDKIQKVEVHQNYMQKRSGLCTVEVYIFSERKNTFKIFGILHEDISSMVSALSH